MTKNCKIFSNMDEGYFRRRVWHNKHTQKDVREIEKFARIFPKGTLMTAPREANPNAPLRCIGGMPVLTYMKPLLPVKGWIKEENFPRYVSLWEAVRRKDETWESWTRFAVVQGRDGMKFPVKPTWKIVINRKLVQYIWEFDHPLPWAMKESIHLLEGALCYLAPGAKLSEADDIRVPGIPDSATGKPGKLISTGPVCSYEKMWKKLGPMFPLKGQALWKYFRSDNIYIEGIKTTREFLGVERFNKLLNAVKKVKKSVFKTIKSGFLFIAWNFGRDAGMDEGKIFNKLRHFCLRHNFFVTDLDIRLARPVKRYQFTDVTVVKMLGDWAEKYFSAKPEKHVPRSILNSITADNIAQVATLAKAGKTICQIAEELKLHISTVKRRRAQAVRKGLLPEQPWKAEKTAAEA